MAASMNTANIANFSSVAHVTHSVPDESNSDIAGVLIKEEVVDDEWLLNCDSAEELYEFADTSLPIDFECSESPRKCSVLNADKTQNHSSILLSLLPDSAQQTCQQTNRDVKTTLNTSSEYMLKLNMLNSKCEIEKCDKQQALTTSVDRKEIVQPVSQKSETVGSVGSQSGVREFKYTQCNQIFGHKGHLEIHRIGHRESESCCSTPNLERVKVKEEVLSDEEGVWNDVPVSEDWNIGCTSCPVETKWLKIEDIESVALDNKTDHVSNAVNILSGSKWESCNSHSDSNCDLGMNPESIKQHLGNNRDAIVKLQSHYKFSRPVKVIVKRGKQQLQLETKPSHVSVAAEHQFKCQECSETFELKSHLVMHEIGHEQYRRYETYSRYHFSKQAQQYTPIYKCSEYNANFELKSRFTRHERLHEKHGNTPCLYTDTLLETKPSHVVVAAEHQFKCQECSETFELKSHLVMHEIGHEQYRRYETYSRYHFSKQVQQYTPIYKCSECSANFELKSRCIRHEQLHEKHRNRPCRCRNTSLPGASDVCVCVVRVCKSCDRRFFASFRLGNWTLCIKCIPPVIPKRKINSSAEVKAKEIHVEQVPVKRNRNIMSNGKFIPTLVDVKRLCCLCGKMSANVIKRGASWMCYDCWRSVRLKNRNVRNFLGLSNEIVPQETARYSHPSCAYRLKLHPPGSHWSKHHRSVYLKEQDVDNVKIGQHFLLSSVSKPFKPAYLQDDLMIRNQSAWFDDCNKSEDEQEGEMVIDTTEVSDVDDGSSLSNVILCDKTGELIDLGCEGETSASDETR